MKDKILLSPVHQLVIPPPPEAAWYAPWNNPDFSWWDAAKWISPLSHLEGMLVHFLSNQVQNLADYASSNGYIGLGTALGMTAQLGHIGAGIIDLPGTLVGLAQISTMAGARAATASGNLTVGILAGETYFVGSLIGVTQISEGIAHQDFATGEALDGTEAASRLFSGISALAMAGATGIEMAGLDTCIPGTPKLFKDGCFTEGTLVLTQTGRMPIEHLCIGRRVIVDPEGGPQRLQPFIDITQWRVLKLEYVRPDTQQVLHMAFLRSAAEADLLSPGDTTPVVIEEMGIEGQARVLAIEPCPPVEEGEGELITATFMQEHIDVRLLKLAGLTEPIEVTGSHPIYSEDQHTFVPVRELGRGERLRTRTGTAVVESILRKPGSWRVYNLEIGSVHRYYVSALDVLVHNACSATSGENAAAAAGREVNNAYYDIWDTKGYETNVPLDSGARPDAISILRIKLER
jgi:hypothetical protein